MEKRRKEITFLAVAVLVLVLAVVLQLRSGSTPTPAAAASAKPVVTAAAPQPAAATVQPVAAPRGVSAAPSLAEVSAEPAKSKRDPFRAVIGCATNARPRPTQVAALPSLPTSRLFPPLRLGSMPPVTPFNVSVAASQPPAAPSPAPAAPPEPPRPRLVGIVDGDQPMAVIRMGEKRFYPRVGESIGEYVLQEVSARRVVLSSATGTLSLSLGGK